LNQHLHIGFGSIQAFGNGEPAGFPGARPQVPCDGLQVRVPEKGLKRDHAARLSEAKGTEMPIHPAFDIMSPMRIVLATALCAAACLTAATMDIGKPSPALTIKRPGKPDIMLSQYTGKVVALALIDTECPHCQNLTKILNQIATEYGPKGVQVVACAFNDHADQLLPAFLQKLQPTFPVGYSANGPVSQYLSWPALSVKPLYVPHLVFLDRKGIVRLDVPGEDPFMTDPEKNLREELDSLLKPGGAASSHAHPKSTASEAPSHP
jgi:thiol-disulfide isomerase/thioredoxin